MRIRNIISRSAPDYEYNINRKSARFYLSGFTHVDSLLRIKSKHSLAIRSKSRRIARIKSLMYTMKDQPYNMHEMSDIIAKIYDIS